MVAAILTLWFVPSGPPLPCEARRVCKQPHASNDPSEVITQCLRTCLASFHAVTACSIARFTLKLMMVVSFQHVGHVGFSPSWVRAHCKKGGFVIRWGAEMGTVTRTSEQKQCPHVSTTG